MSSPYSITIAKTTSSSNCELGWKLFYSASCQSWEVGFFLVLWHINLCRLFNAKSFLYIYIKYIWFGWVLWHGNHCGLFNAKSSLYIYIRYIWVGLGWVGFYGISTLIGYLMSNPLYKNISNIYDLVWLGLVLWDINHCRLFNAKFFLYRFIKYIWFYCLLDLTWL